MLIFIKKIVTLILALISIYTLMTISRFNLNHYQFLACVTALCVSTGAFIWFTLKS